MDFDAIVVGSGITGGWVAKELCDRGLKTLILERGRHVEHRVDYHGFRHALGSAESRPGTRAGARRALRHPEHLPRVQRRDQAMVGARQRTSVHHAGRAAFLVDPRLSPRWPFDHLGPPDLPDERLRFQRQQARRQWHRLADSLRGSFAVVRPGRTIRRHLRRQRGTGTTAGRAVPAAAGAQLPRARVQADRWRPTIPTRRVTVGRCAHLTEPTAEHIALGRGPCQLRSVCERGCGYGAIFLLAVRHAAGGEEDRQPDHRHRCHRRAARLRPRASGASPACASSTPTRGRAARTRRASCSCAPRPSAARRSCSRRARNIFPTASPIARTRWAAT